MLISDQADGDGAKQATAEQSAARIGAIVTRSVLRWLQDVREVEATSCEPDRHSKLAGT